MDVKNIKDELKKRLKNKRYEHSLGVADCAAQLAKRFSVDPEKAYLAGLLHDCAREFPSDRMIDEAKKRKIEITAIEQKIPFMLHAPIGAKLAQEFYQIKDREILQAIALHTVGGPEMTPLDKIIYFADMIEPNRSYPGVGELRYLAEVASLDEMLLKGFDQTLNFVIEKNGLLHPSTVEARNELIISLAQKD